MARIANGGNIWIALFNPQVSIFRVQTLSPVSVSISNHGQQAGVVETNFVLGFAQEALQKSLADAGLACEVVPFGGECSQNEIDRLRAIAESAHCGAVLGIGGGKKRWIPRKRWRTLWAYCRHRAPTIASTDAPCSALSVIYTDAGEFDRYLLLPNNPDRVIVDTKIVAGAPARLLAAVSVMRWQPGSKPAPVHAVGATTMAGGHCTQAALALAELCYNTLLEEAKKRCWPQNSTWSPRRWSALLKQYLSERRGF